MRASGESIQIENGKYTRIHNDILNALALARLTGAEYRCLLFLLRKTYGWGKKEDTISSSQWATGVGIDESKRHNVWRTLQGLEKKNVIYSIDNGNNRPKTYGFVKYWEQWDASLFEQTVIPQDNSTVMQDDNSEKSTVIPRDNSTVMPQDNKTVITRDTHKRKERKLKKAASDNSVTSCENDGKFTMQLLQDTKLFFHFPADSKKRAAMLEDTYTLDNIRTGVKRAAESHKRRISNGGKNTNDPVAYLTSILADEAIPKPESKPKRKGWITDSVTGEKREVAL